MRAPHLGVISRIGHVSLVRRPPEGDGLDAARKILLLAGKRSVDVLDHDPRRRAGKSGPPRPTLMTLPGTIFMPVSAGLAVELDVARADAARWCSRRLPDRARASRARRRPRCTLPDRRSALRRRPADQDRAGVVVEHGLAGERTRQMLDGDGHGTTSVRALDQVADYTAASGRIGRRPGLKFLQH